MRGLLLLLSIVVVILGVVGLVISASKDDHKTVEVVYTQKTTSRWDFDSTTCTTSASPSDRQFHVTCVESAPYHPGRH
jgi:hypothetical protein